MKRDEDKDFGKQERLVLCGMIYNDFVMGKIHSKWPSRTDWVDGDGLFASKFANMIAKLCLNYYAKHDKAPDDAIMALFEDWAKDYPNEAEAKTVESIILGVISEFGDKKYSINPEYIIDRAGEYFTRIVVTRAIETAQRQLQIGKVHESFNTITSTNRVEMGQRVGEFLFSNPQIWKDALNKEKKHPLLNYSGALGRFFGNSLRRSGFITFLAPPKRGKSTWLMDIAIRACQNRLKVAFFEIGDMQQDEMDTRFAIRFTGIPDSSPDGKWPCTIDYPISIDKTGVECKSKIFQSPIEEDDAVEGATKFKLKKFKSETKDFVWRIFYDSRSVGVSDIIADIERLRKADWMPDIVIIDYADNLREPPKSGNMTKLDQTNINWQMMRAISQHYKVLLLTATQSNRPSYSSKVIKMEHIGEDARKLAHVTGCVGINQTKQEKEIGVFRLNWVVVRSMKPIGTVRCASCLPLGLPSVVSTFERDEDEQD